MSRNRAEAIKAGVDVCETKHSMKRRMPSHNYSAKGTYMLTLVVDGRKPVFGLLRGDGFADSGASEAPRVELSPLGRTIRDVEIKKIATFYPMVEVWKLCIMPDHIHMIVRVKEDMPAGKHLGQVVKGFKTGCTRAWWRLSGAEPCGETRGTVAGRPCGETQGTEAGRPCGEMQGTEAERPCGETQGPGAGRPCGETQGTVAERPCGEMQGTVAERPCGETRGTEAGIVTVPDDFPSGVTTPPDTRRPVLFEQGYCDKILLREGQLDNWKRYLDDNPRRLAIKRQCPDYFTVVHQIKIGEWSCQMVGNRYLLSYPEKAAVVVHSAWSDKEFAKRKQKWLALAENGGVLISAAIATREKEVMREAINRGYRLISLRENGFPPFYKPSGESFAACTNGTLLQISPWEYHMNRRTISREQCLQLNRLAEEIVVFQEKN